MGGGWSGDAFAFVGIIVCCVVFSSASVIGFYLCLVKCFILFIVAHVVGGLL